MKYCGGCHPRYDRVAAFQRIAERLGDRAAFVSWDHPEADSALVVCGCPSACAEVGEIELPVRWVTSEAEAEETTAHHLLTPAPGMKDKEEDS